MISTRVPVSCRALESDSAGFCPCMACGVRTQGKCAVFGEVPCIRARLAGSLP